MKPGNKREGLKTECPVQNTHILAAIIINILAVLHGSLVRVFSVSWDFLFPIRKAGFMVCFPHTQCSTQNRGGNLGQFSNLVQRREGFGSESPECEFWPFRLRMTLERVNYLLDARGHLPLPPRAAEMRLPGALSSLWGIGAPSCDCPQPTAFKKCSSSFSFK